MPNRKQQMAEADRLARVAFINVLTPIKTWTEARALVAADRLPRPDTPPRRFYINLKTFLAAPMQPPDGAGGEELTQYLRLVRTAPDWPGTPEARAAIAARLLTDLERKPA